MASPANNKHVINSIKASMREIDSKIHLDAMGRFGGAYTTGLMVVGKDMLKGLAYAWEVVSGYSFSRRLNKQQICEALYERLNQSAQTLECADSEGYVAGTMVWYAMEVKKLALKNTKDD